MILEIPCLLCLHATFIFSLFGKKKKLKFPLLSSLFSGFGGNQREMVVDVLVLMNFCIIKFGWEL